MSLANFYRPHRPEDVCGQKSVLRIIEEQIRKREFAHCYLFTGPTGCGKTTLGRILAFAINQYVDENGEIRSADPLEIDAASNNGVDNIRAIISSAYERALIGEYKVFILDEAHMLTIQSWNALLKIIEEPPSKTIFILCTTDPQKIPSTILNRVLRLNLTKINTNEIVNRLRYICENEHFTNYDEACEYIAKLSNGGMRDAISLLEKCSNYSTDLSINNVLECLGNFSYKTMFELTNGIIDGDSKKVLSIIDDIYNSGNDLKTFVNQYLDFVLDLNKYCLFNSTDVVRIPASMEEDMKYATGIENNSQYYLKLVNKLLDLTVNIKNDTMFKTTISIYFMNLCKGAW